MSSPSIHTQLTPLADGITMASPSPLTAVLWHHNGGTEKVIGYLGFNDSQLAEACYTYLTDSVGRYNRSSDAGVCKPRKAHR